MEICYAVLMIITSIVSICGKMIALNPAECVEWHNKFRKLHQAPKLNWSSLLARDAQAWASFLATWDIFQHSHATGQGESLFRIKGDGPNLCRRAIKIFYEEEPLYNYDDGKCSRDAGHFTQLVWVNTTELGVGKAERANGEIILVFRYTPPGNFCGSFKENVKPKLKSGSARVSAFCAIGLTFSLLSQRLC